MSTESPFGCDEVAQGRVVDAADREQLDQALQIALDYRGDVTIARRDGDDVTGYLFDRQANAPGRPPAIRMLCSAGGEKVVIPIEQITRLTFSGRDTAAGRSFDTWMRKYVEKKIAGESANIFAEPLDE